MRKGDIIGVEKVGKERERKRDERREKEAEVVRWRKTTLAGGWLWHCDCALYHTANNDRIEINNFTHRKFIYKSLWYSIGSIFPANQIIYQFRDLDI